VNRTYRTEAIILKRLNLGEADRLLTVFSKHYGKLRLMAKGVRRLSSRKKGHLELFSQSRLFIAKAKNLDLITEAETVHNFPQLRKNLSHVQTAYLFCELIDQLTAEGQEHQAVYQLLLSSFLQLDRQSIAPDRLIVFFEKKLLQLLGFGLPSTINRQTLEAHILSITEKPLNSPKLTEVDLDLHV
jgi:DNA repair protein RecO (recombination protein O)